MYDQPISIDFSFISSPNEVIKKDLLDIHSGVRINVSLFQGFIEYQISQVLRVSNGQVRVGSIEQIKHYEVQVEYTINDLNPKNLNFLVILSQSVRADQIFGGFNIQTIQQRSSDPFSAIDQLIIISLFFKFHFFDAD